MTIRLNGDAVTAAGVEYEVQTPGLPWSFDCDEAANYFRFELRKGNQRAGDLLRGSGVERCELRGPHVPIAGEDVWLSMHLRITGTPVATSNAFTIVSQMQQRPEPGEVSKSPSWAQHILEGQFRIVTRHDSTAVTTTSPEEAVRYTTAAANIADGEWHHLVTHIVFGWDNDATLESWIDGAKVVDLTGINVGYNDSGTPSSWPDFKIGTYRTSQSPRLITEYANVELEYEGGSLLDRVANPLALPAFRPWTLY